VADIVGQSLVRIGQIVGFHGLKGDVKVRPTHFPPDWPGQLKEMQVVLGKEERWLKIARAQIRERIVWVRFENFPDRTSVEPFMKATLFARQEDLPSLDEGEQYVDDLVGMTVRDLKTKTDLGVVKDLVSAGQQDYLEIHITAKNDTVIIPYNEHFFPKVDEVVWIANLEGFIDEV